MLGHLLHLFELEPLVLLEDMLDAGARYFEALVMLNFLLHLFDRAYGAMLLLNSRCHLQYCVFIVAFLLFLDMLLVEVCWVCLQVPQQALY